MWQNIEAIGTLTIMEMTDDKKSKIQNIYFLT